MQKILNSINLNSLSSVSAKSLVSILGYLCLFFCVLFAFKIGSLLFHWFTGEGLDIPEFAMASDGGASSLAGKNRLSDFSVITQRNIFGKISQKRAEPNEPVRKTELNLRLVGTNTAVEGQKFAIIEDVKAREQDIFRVDEVLFNTGAKVSEIFSESVRLRRDGEIETLVIEEGVSSGSSGKDSIEVNEDASEFSIPEEELSDALANLPRLLSQARAVPFFRNGKSIGMRLFAIRRGSLYEKLGLKNGDIVLSVNDNSLSDPSQALKLFEQLKNERAIGVVVERNGGQQELRYSIQ